jgi:hypothetical protein
MNSAKMYPVETVSRTEDKANPKLKTNKIASISTNVFNKLVTLNERLKNRKKNQSLRQKKGLKMGQIN